MGMGKSFRLASKYAGDYGRMVLQFPNGDFTVWSIVSLLM